jgi:hypothetical protein
MAARRRIRCERIRVDVSTWEVSDFGPAGLHRRGRVYREEVTRPMVAALRTAIRESPRDATWLSRELAALLPARLAGRPSENGMPAAPHASAGYLEPELLDGVVVGTHVLEGPFRWTEPVSLVRFARSPNRSFLRLYTGAIRGDPAGYLHGIYMEGQRVPSHQVRMHAYALEILLPGTEDPGESGVVLICRPLVEPRNGSGGRRRLGMPITHLELRPA